MIVRSNNYTEEKEVYKFEGPEEQNDLTSVEQLLSVFNTI